MPKKKKVLEIEEETKEIIKPKRKSKARYFLVVFVLLAVAAGGYFLSHRKTQSTYRNAYTVAKQDVKQTVIATGTVTSESNLNLGFKTSGVISRINVKIGDKVRQGQTLASLDARDAQAQVAVAQAGVGAAQVAVNNAKNSLASVTKQQATLVANAKSTLLSAGLTAEADTVTSVTITVSGNYTGEEGSYKITPYYGNSGAYFSYSGLENGIEPVTLGFATPLGTRGLYVTFSQTINYGNWTINIPNTKSSSYVTNYNAYQAALETQNQQLTSAQGAVDTALAQLASAKAQLLVANNAYQNNLIIAPISGLVTSVDSKIGEQAAALKEIIVLQDSSELHVESQIPESSISQVQKGQMVDMTFDAFGPDKHLVGKVISIDPASTVISGVIDFRVLSSLPADPNIKPGMTVNMSIAVTEEPNVLAVPNRLISSTGNNKFVKVKQGAGVKDVPITVGLSGDNFTEVTSGLSEGQILVTEVK